ncbi:MAG: FAD-dependent monooxygenase [Hyphomicrobiaceae bacterium]
MSSVAVVGTGLAGLSAALALAKLDVATLLIGPRLDPAQALRDTRSTALFGPSVDFLTRLDVLERLEPAPVPLRGLRLIDATGSLFRAPEVLFNPSEIGVDAFGVNIENSALLTTLAGRAVSSPAIDWHEATALAVETEAGAAYIDMSDGERAEVALIIGADGERSLCRKAAGISDRSWSYPQVALAGRFSHRRPHNEISTELHRRSGPLTTVPLRGNWSSLVWVETPEVSERLLGLDDEAFAGALDQALGGVLGGVTSVGARASFPLSGVTADTLGGRRVALVGEAAHRLPPIGAQGLNLGLRDAAWLAELVADAIASGSDPGAPELLQAYDRTRRADVASRTAVVDTLNRSLIADWLSADAARSAGLAALKTIGPLRRLFMREGMGPGGALPRLMQPVVQSEAITPVRSAGRHG